MPDDAAVGDVATGSQPLELMPVPEARKVRTLHSVPSGDSLVGRNRDAADAAAVFDCMTVVEADEESIKVNVVQISGANLPPHVLSLLAAGEREVEVLLEAVFHLRSNA